VTRKTRDFRDRTRAIAGTKILPASASIRRDLARALEPGAQTDRGNAMKAVLLSAVLLTIATAAQAQHRVQSPGTMGGWGSVKPSNTMGDGPRTFRPEPPREWRGTLTTPSEGIRNTLTPGMRRPLR
jgi:hypothetical protein